MEAVWDTLSRTEEWPSWWDDVESVVQLEPGDENGVGACHRLTWKTRLPYKISFVARVTRVERPVVLEAAITGEVEGAGRWTLSSEGPVTIVRYDWNVRTTKRWMNWLAPMARPVFEWNHAAVMKQGGKCLAGKLGETLLAAERVRSDV